MDSCFVFRRFLNPAAVGTMKSVVLITNWYTWLLLEYL
jgi:hypothetical protein